MHILAVLGKLFKFHFVVTRVYRCFVCAFLSTPAAAARSADLTARKPILHVREVTAVAAFGANTHSTAHRQLADHTALRPVPTVLAPEQLAGERGGQGRVAGVHRGGEGCAGVKGHLRGGRARGPRVRSNLGTLVGGEVERRGGVAPGGKPAVLARRLDLLLAVVAAHLHTELAPLGIHELLLGFQAEVVEINMFRHLNKQKK